MQIEGLKYNLKSALWVLIHYRTLSWTSSVKSILTWEKWRSRPPDSGLSRPDRHQALPNARHRALPSSEGLLHHDLELWKVSYWRRCIGPDLSWNMIINQAWCEIGFELFSQFSPVIQKDWSEYQKWQNGKKVNAYCCIKANEKSGKSERNKGDKGDWNLVWKWKTKMTRYEKKW